MKEFLVMASHHCTILCFTCRQPLIPPSSLYNPPVIPSILPCVHPSVCHPFASLTFLYSGFSPLVASPLDVLAIIWQKHLPWFESCITVNIISWKCFITACVYDPPPPHRMRPLCYEPLWFCSIPHVLLFVTPFLFPVVFVPPPSESFNFSPPSFQPMFLPHITLFWLQYRSIWWLLWYSLLCSAETWTGLPQCVSVFMKSML